MSTEVHEPPADYVVNASGRIDLNDQGQSVVQTYREAEEAFDALQTCWAGACLAGLFLRHPWLQSLRITLSASAEFDDQGGCFRSINNSVTQVLPVPGVPLPESAMRDGAFDDSEAASDIEADLDECDHDLYESISDAPNNYDDVVLDLRRSSIAQFLHEASISGAQAYQAFFRVTETNHS